MLINNSGITTNSNSAKQKDVATTTDSATDQHAPATVAKDSVELSEKAQHLSRLETQLVTSSDVDIDRVDAIRSAIESGSYEINPERIATKLLASDTLS